MNFSPDLQQAIEQIASDQGMSSEEFIVKTLIEKINSLKQATSHSSLPQTGLEEKDGILVFNTESLDHVDFNGLIAQSREESDWEQLKL
ncbi:MAG: hypothetical protein HC881_17660 [Leptolyngbyaceae cyanobacterium SL_7_1]|nr:hypothetical protein [Leptolyngbyaceae cyanobacterium SL_7_1]